MGIEQKMIIYNHHGYSLFYLFIMIYFKHKKLLKNKNAWLSVWGGSGNL